MEGESGDRKDGLKTKTQIIASAKKVCHLTWLCAEVTDWMDGADASSCAPKVCKV